MLNVISRNSVKLNNQRLFDFLFGADAYKSASPEPVHNAIFLSSLRTFKTPMMCVLIISPASEQINIFLEPFYQIFY